MYHFDIHVTANSSAEWFPATNKIILYLSMSDKRVQKISVRNVLLSNTSVNINAHNFN